MIKYQLHTTDSVHFIVKSKDNWGIAGPALQAILAGHVPPTEQGELQGALTSMISATSIVGPLVMTNLFAYFTKPGAPIHFFGAPFLLGSILLMGSDIVAYSVLRKEKVVAVNKGLSKSAIPFQETFIVSNSVLVVH